MTLTELTFIILVRPHLISEGSKNDHIEDVIPSEEEISTYQMVGDVNLFLKGSPEEGDEEVEAEVMIAGSRIIVRLGMKAKYGQNPRIVVKASPRVHCTFCSITLHPLIPPHLSVSLRKDLLRELARQIQHQYDCLRSFPFA